MKKINKVLVANRGEIAMRILRTAKEMNISTVAIFSEADRSAPYVRFADEAVCIGPAASNLSYLNQDKIIQVCKELHVDAIHPGYGFLSENAVFAKRVTDEHIIFIGPSAEAIQVMGSKLAAKQVAAQYDIPMVPGTAEAIVDRKKAKVVAGEIGYPVLIKASAGGGGKGMRVVLTETDFDQQMDRAVSEAEAAFGDGSVFIEKYILSPKHIEIQILGDQHGNIIHLFDRECSIQRRHQKVIEEAPSISISDEVREEMGKCAVLIAKSCGYYGAGTVEFILDEKGKFYFLEMNTRLQVEHPVTELITGIDLVKQMFLIAEGQKLAMSQSDVIRKGHAIESRVYAEDSNNDFLPDVGTLHVYKTPKGNGVRVDDGFEEGMAIPIHYDPMISKLITYGQNREEAIAKMIRAIDEYQIHGVKTTLEFCKFVMENEVFRNGSFDTNFVARHFQVEGLNHYPNESERAVAALIAVKMFQKQGHDVTPEANSISKQISKWKTNRSKG